MKYIDGGVCVPQGFAAAGVHCGFRKNKTKKDLALIVSQTDCSAAAVYTTNKVKGPPSAAVDHFHGAAAAGCGYHTESPAQLRKIQ